ncbi:MAG TPA: sodium:proton antiporter [Polyangia bacterium]|nr:sodium:proton antiporter [Polyangia bacterium]
MTYPTPIWAVAPFAFYLLLIATLPLFLGAFWEHNRNKLIVAAVVSAPVLIYLVGVRAGGGQMLLRTGFDYVAFIALLGALFTISGGIYLRGSLVGTTLVNTAFLGVGAILGSLIGTTGASVLLIRPLLRANQQRAYTTHMVVFFIFIVSNGAGLLTPLGDPPLFLGFLRGVPFTWTLRLAAPWALVNGVLLVLFAILDRIIATRERRRPRKAGVVSLHPSAPQEPFRLDGAINLFWLLGIVVVVFVMGRYGTRLFGDSYLRSLVQILGLLGCGALSLVSTRREVHEANRFNWGPIVEVAVVFIGVFVTMIPALSFLGERGASLGITKPWQFFWASGALSSVLDNAPTYLTFASLAVGVTNSGGGMLSLDNLGGLAAHPSGQHLLAAVSCGAVFMGAITYIGNGPNFMVKAIAEQHHVRMPSFFGYTLWSFAILVPLFGVVSHIFF